MSKVECMNGNDTLDVQSKQPKLLIIKHCDEGKSPPIFSMFKDKNQLTIKMDV